MRQVESIGPYGARVAILRRHNGGRYILRWTDPMTGKKVAKTTDYKVLTKAKAEALDKSKELLDARIAGPDDGKLTWSQLFRHYEQNYLPLHEGKRWYGVDKRSLMLWRAVLPPHQAVENCEKSQLLDFLRRRQAGILEVPGRSLGPCSPRTAGSDLVWLRRVVNIAMGDSKKIARNPVALVEIPKTARPKQPIATWERFHQLRPHCEGRGSQDMFGGFMDLLVGLGWRVSALTQVHLEDVDLRPSKDAPNGQILKRQEYDKKGYEQYVPISDWLAPRLQDLLTRRRVLGVKSQWLFPKVTDPQRSWDLYYVTCLIRIAEDRAGLEPLDGGNFHPWRRMWATLRKHLPLKDVAYAGCWDEATLLKHYQKSDDHTVLSVMNAGFPSP